MSPFNVLKIVWRFTKEIWKKYRNKFIAMEVAVILASLMSNLSIALLIPAFHFLENGNQEKSNSHVVNYLAEGLRLIGLEPSFLNILVCIAFLFVSAFLAKTLEGFLRARVVVDIQVNLQRTILSKSLYASYTKFQSFKASEFQNAILLECSKAANAVHLLCTYYSGVIMVATCLSFAFAISMESFFIVLVSGVIIAPITNIFINRSNQIAKKIIVNNESIAQRTTDVLSGMKYIKSSRSANQMLEFFLQPLKKGMPMRLFQEQALVNVLNIPNFLSGVILILLLYLGVYQFNVPILELGVFIVLVQKAYTSYSMLKGKQGSLVSYIPSYFKAHDLINSLNEDQKPFDKGQDLTFEKNINIKNVSFKVGQNVILEDVSFSIKKGETIAFVGFSGSGKTTLMDIMLGLVPPSSGGVYYDEQSILDVAPKSMASNIGYISQQPFVFPETFRNNITLGEEKYSEAQILEAIKTARIEPLLTSLEGNLDAMIAGSFRPLSGGESQRVALARELIKNPSILFLDEATSALDNETEQHIKNVLEQYKGKKTIIMIAHRLSTIKNVDCIYVFEKGRMVESGNFSSLLNQNGVFAKLYSSEK